MQGDQSAQSGGRSGGASGVPGAGAYGAPGPYGVQDMNNGGAMADSPLPYHRLARITLRYSWWRPLVGTLVAFGLYLFVTGALYAVVDELAASRGYATGADGTVKLSTIPDTALDLALLAMAIPFVLLTVRWIGGRPAGTVSSVTGSLRWGWLGLCALLAVPIVSVAMFASMLLPGDGGGAGFEWAGWGFFLPALGMLLVLIPFQAAAEEYLFRGWLTQAAGAYFRPLWLALTPQAVLFALAHGLGTPWGFADLVVFAVATGWLTWRTGGLEAAIGLHWINNLIAFVLSAATVDGLAADETAADAGGLLVAVDVASILLYAGAVVWLARRRNLDRMTSAPVIPVLPSVAFSGHPSALPRS